MFVCSIVQKGHYCVVYCIEMVLVISGFLVLKRNAGKAHMALEYLLMSDNKN